MFEEYVANEYLRAGVVFLVIFVAIRLLMFFLARVVPVFTKRTKTDLDDVIMKQVSMPLTVLAILTGVRIAIGELNIISGLSGTLDGVLMTLTITFGSILVYYILDALVTVGYRDFGEKIGGHVNESLLQFFHSLLKIIMIIAGFLAILASWGIEIGPLLAGLGVAGIAIAFALKSTLSNVFGGISMLLDRSINVGDLLELDEDGIRGHVLRINLRSTKIKTRNNKLVIVPNGRLADANIKNLALPRPTTRVVVPFSVAYGTDIKKMEKLVVRELSKIEGVDKKERMFVRFMKMGDSSLEYNAYFHVGSFDRVRPSVGDANTRIYNVLNKAGIEIPFPQMDVNLKR